MVGRPAAVGRLVIGGAAAEGEPCDGAACEGVVSEGVVSEGVAQLEGSWVLSGLTTGLGSVGAFGRSVAST